MESQDAPIFESKQPEELLVKRRKFPLRIIPFLLLFLLLIGGTYFIYGNFGLPGEKLLSKTTTELTPTPSLPPSSVGTVPAWHVPQNYVALDANGTLLIGTLKSKRESIIVKSGGKILGTPQFQALAQSGKFLLYIKLPDELITEFQKNPPYEFHGSSDYELHLVTLGGGSGKLEDTVIDTNVSLSLGSAVIVFDDAEKGIYYPKYVDGADKVYYYSLSSKSAEESSLPGYLMPGAAHSPTYSQYVFPEALPKTPSDTAINTKYNLALFAKDGTKKKVLYSDFISGETSTIFPTETIVFLSREDFVDGPNSICYIEKIGVPEGNVTPLRAQECPPGSSMTNFHDLSLSPDGKLLLAAYSQDTVGPNPARLGNFLVYDLESDASQTLGETSEWYGKYFWVENNEILTTIQSTENPVTYRINLSTGEATPDDSFRGKTVLGVF